MRTINHVLIIGLSVMCFALAFMLRSEHLKRLQTEQENQVNISIQVDGTNAFGTNLTVTNLFIPFIHIVTNPPPRIIRRPLGPMSSIFDSAVYSLQQSAPFAGPKPMSFIAEKARWNGEVKLTVRPRPEVASRLWWVLEWIEDDQPVSVSAQTSELCFWRAIQMHKQKQRQHELEGPLFNGSKKAGFENGEGI